MTKQVKSNEDFTPDQIAAIKKFIARVNSRAEKTIVTTGMVSGAHWNAMQEELRNIECKFSSEDA